MEHEGLPAESGREAREGTGERNAAPSEWGTYAFWLGDAADPDNPSFILRCRGAMQLYGMVGVLQKSLGKDVGITITGWHE